MRAIKDSTSEYKYNVIRREDETWTYFIGNVNPSSGGPFEFRSTSSCMVLAIVAGLATGLATGIEEKLDITAQVKWIFSQVK